ncbi:MAG: STAS domain-containing protein [Planctomycetota bacterium]|jgi:anti-anti-sigma factor
MTIDAVPSASGPAIEWATLGEGATVARVAGFFDQACVQALEAKAEGLSPGSPLILNLSAVEYLSSSGIGEIVFLASRFRLAIAAPSESVRKLLMLAEVFPILDIGGSEEEALSLSRQKC